VVNAYGFPIYTLGIGSPGGDAASSSSATVFPVLVSESGIAAAYPAVAANSVAANQVSASLSALLTQLVNQYIVGYVPSGPAETGTFRNVDVRLTPPVGLPQLTARVSTGRR
jgi:Ca-activated chloride channel homolog